MSSKGHLSDIARYIWAHGWLAYCPFFILDIVIIGVRIFGSGASRGVGAGELIIFTQIIMDTLRDNIPP